jgi:hypothetical protein
MPGEEINGMEVSSGKRRWRWFAAATLATALLVTAATAGAAQAPTRDEYVAQLEGVCKPDAEATQRAMKGARSDISAERLTLAASKFAEAASIFGSTVKKISVVSRPPADATKLDRWFGYLKAQESYLEQITAQLRGGYAIKAQRLTARFIHNGNLANNTVLAFGFNYCGFKFSRYG